MEHTKLLRHYAQRLGDTILLTLTANHAGFDFATSAERLRAGRALLDTSERGVRTVRLGSFGEYPVVLAVQPAVGVATITIEVPTPDNGATRRPTASLAVPINALREVLDAALGGEPRIAASADDSA